MKTVIIQLVIGERFHFKQYLYKKENRAYRIKKKVGMALLEVFEGDMPKFRITQESKLADDTHIIDLSIGEVEDDSLVVNTEVTGKVINSAPKVSKSTDGKKEKPKKKEVGLSEQDQTPIVDSSQIEEV